MFIITLLLSVPIIAHFLVKYITKNDVKRLSFLWEVFKKYLELYIFYF